MNEATRKKVIYATLPVALTWAVFSLTSSPKKSLSPEEEYVTIQPISQAGVETATSQFIDIETEQQKTWGLDPFRSYRSEQPVSVGPQSGLSWILSGIIFSKTRPLAFINKKTVAIGDKIGDATVVAIDQTTVTLEQRGHTITLKVNKG